LSCPVLNYSLFAADNDFEEAEEDCGRVIIQIQIV